MQGLLARLPHRPPWVLVDEIVQVEPGSSIVCRKTVRGDEDWVPAHFPGQPIMPGVLVVEALAQAAALLYLADHPEATGMPVYLVGMDKWRFRRMVRPGDVIELRARSIPGRRGFWTFEAEATVDGHRVASGSFLATRSFEA
jgi:3-hydroxyacyl-[acyl-carrier-protein] dehydratase